VAVDEENHVLSVRSPTAVATLREFNCVAFSISFLSVLRELVDKVMTPMAIEKQAK